MMVACMRYLNKDTNFTVLSSDFLSAMADAEGSASPMAKGANSGCVVLIDGRKRRFIVPVRADSYEPVHS